MQYGDAKWIIYPLGVKVRLMKPENWEDIDSNYLLESDYAGVEHLKHRLEELEYTHYDDDLIPYQVEPLDPDWKSKHLDHHHDTFGQPSIYEEWFCEKEAFHTTDDRDVYCAKRRMESGEKEPHPSLQKQWVSEFCESNGLGRAIPLFLAQYQEDIKWIESHLVEVKHDRRGTNPNSLKNLRQFRKVEE